MPFKRKGEFFQPILCLSTIFSSFCIFTETFQHLEIAIFKVLWLLHVFPWLFKPYLICLPSKASPEREGDRKSLLLFVWVPHQILTTRQKEHPACASGVCLSLSQWGIKMPSSALTWSVEQSGHATAVGDLLLTVFCTSGDGCHLKHKQGYVFSFYLLQPDRFISCKKKKLKKTVDWAAKWSKMHLNVLI